MKINIRRCNPYGKVKWREVEITDGGATIKLDVHDGEDFKSFCDALLDAALCEMEMDDVITYLTDTGYTDEIIERYEESKSNAA